MSEKRMTRSSTSSTILSSSVATNALNNHHNHHHHHNNHHRGHHQPQQHYYNHQNGEAAVLVRESKMGLRTTTTPTKTTQQRKRKLTSAAAGTGAATDDDDVDSTSRRSSPASVATGVGEHHVDSNTESPSNSSTSSSSVSAAAAAAAAASHEKARRLAAIAATMNAPSVRHSSRLLKNSASNCDMSHGCLSSSSVASSSSHQDETTISTTAVAVSTSSNQNNNNREKRKLMSKLDQHQQQNRKRLATEMVGENANMVNEEDDTTEQAYLNSSITSSSSSLDNNNVTTTPSGKIVTRRRSSNMLINQLKAGINGSRVASVFEQSFPSINRRRVPTHPLGLTQSLKLQNQQLMQPELSSTAATNLENLIDQSSSCSSLASSSTSAAAAATAAATTTPTNHQRSNHQNKSGALKELNNTANKKQRSSAATQKGAVATAAAAAAASSSATPSSSLWSSKPRRGGSRQQIKKEDYDVLTAASPVSTTTSTFTGEDTKLAAADEADQVLRCPVQGCNSEGCLDGRSDTHNSYDKCPAYFGMTADECRRRKADLEKRMREIKDKLAKINDGKKMLRNKKITQEQCDYYAKLVKELKKQLPNTLQTSPTTTDVGTGTGGTGIRLLSTSSLSLLHQHILPDATPELLGDIKNLSTSFIITSITNSFAPTPMPHFMMGVAAGAGGLRVPPPTSLAANSAAMMLQHQHVPLQSHPHTRSTTSMSASMSSSSGGVVTADSASSSTLHSQNQRSQQQQQQQQQHQVPPVSSFLNRIMPIAPLPPDIDDLTVSPLELDFFRDVLVAGMTENVPSENRRLLKQFKEDNKLIQLGNWEIETWYKSPYPDDYWQLNKIFLCQFCLQYMKSHTVLSRHLEKCVWRHPPGREIYRKNALSFFEVDGKFNKIYCQNLCLLAKLFLDHKTLYFDVEPFLFYILTRYDDTTGSFEMIGYFSKEKQSIMNYNLSCILILPQFMNQRYGRMLIDFSYLLSRVEGKFGSPERPLSDLGLLSYRSYWKSKVLTYLAQHIDDAEILVKDISAETGILSNDIISTLQYIGLVKYWKGKHVILKDMELIEQLQKRKYSSSHHEMDVDPSCLKWSPYVYQTIIHESESSPPPTPIYTTASSSTHHHHRSGRQASASYD